MLQTCHMPYCLESILENPEKSKVKFAPILINKWKDYFKPWHGDCHKDGGDFLCFRYILAELYVS